MTENFDNFINSIMNSLITEKTARCKGPTLRQLSDKQEFRWMKCAPNPYSYGFKRVFFSRKDGSFDWSKCDRNPRRGTEAGETCALRQQILNRRRRANKKRKK